MNTSVYSKGHRHHVGSAGLYVGVEERDGGKGGGERREEGGRERGKEGGHLSYHKLGNSVTHTLHHLTSTSLNKFSKNWSSSTVTQVLSSLRTR